MDGTHDGVCSLREACVVRFQSGLSGAVPCLRFEADSELWLQATKSGGVVSCRSTSRRSFWFIEAHRIVIEHLRLLHGRLVRSVMLSLQGRVK